MKLDECGVGQEVSMRDRELGYLVGDIISVSPRTVSVKFRNPHRPKPIRVAAERLWPMDEQLQLFEEDAS